ncbi:MAG: putative lipid II flippase FtsW [Oscillospiraceae bacterium]
MSKKVLNRKSKNSMDITFLAIVLVLVSIGLVMLFSSSFAYALYRHDDSFAYIRDQFIFAVLGIASMIVVSKIDYRIFKKLTYIILSISIILLIIVLFMRPLNGARRWIIIPGFGTFQPSETAKFSVVLFFSYWISKYQKHMNTFKFGVLPFMIVLGIICGLMVLEPHLSGTVLIVLMALSMMWIGGTNKIWFGIGGGLISAILVFIVVFTNIISYALSRIEFWIDPFKDPLNSGFQTIQSLLAIGSGGFLGVGLGSSRQKYLYIPEPQNDFIFAVIAEELGFVGCFIIISLFIVFMFRGFYIALRAKDQFGSMLAVGLTLQIGLQALFNIAVVTNTIPNTGISLPFFSYGGTSLVMILAQMGVILSVSRHSHITKD